ncbi:hypothetical protein MOO08_13670, partial [Escherichia coli]|nr:hypothetical protein [Escherichia coli]
AHDVPLGCAPDEYDDLISGTCSHLPYIKTYVFGTLAVYIISIITMIAEDFACSGNGSMIFLICYFSTFSMLMLAPTDSSKQ